MRGKLLFKIKVKEDSEELDKLSVMKDVKVVGDEEIIACSKCNHKRTIRKDARVKYYRYYFYLDNLEKVENILVEPILFPGEHYNKQIGDLFVGNQTDICSNCNQEAILAFGTNLCEKCRDMIWKND